MRRAVIYLSILKFWESRLNLESSVSLGPKTAIILRCESRPDWWFWVITICNIHVRSGLPKLFLMFMGIHPFGSFVLKSVTTFTIGITLLSLTTYIHKVVEVAAGFNGDVRRCVGLVALAICVEKDSDDLLTGATVMEDQCLSNRDRQKFWACLLYKKFYSVPESSCLEDHFKLWKSLGKSGEKFLWPFEIALKVPQKGIFFRLK